MGFSIFLFIIIFILAIFIGLKLPGWKGRAGENFVTSKLNRLDPTYYITLNDLMLPSKGSLDTTQIDHVVISNYGIFVIETKAYKGWIFGGVNQEYWTQVIYKHKQKFYNPLRQNFAHIKAIEDLIGPQRIKTPIISFVAFPNADKIKVSGTDCVGCARDIIKKIESYINIIYSNKEQDEICNLLITKDIIDKEARNVHTKGVREIKNKKEELLKQKPRSAINDLLRIFDEPKRRGRRESFMDDFNDFDDRPKYRRYRKRRRRDDFF